MTATVVQLETTHGVLAFELYDDALTGGLSSAFIRLAGSGQLEGRTFQTLVPGLGLMGAAKGAAEDRVLGLPWGGIAGGYTDIRHDKARLRHVGAGLLTCRPCDGVVPTSTFMITVAPQPKLDSEYIVFGRLCSGMSVVQGITKMQVSDSFTLYTPIDVLRCTRVQQPRSSRPETKLAMPSGHGDAKPVVTRVAKNSLLTTL